MVQPQIEFMHRDLLITSPTHTTGSDPNRAALKYLPNRRNPSRSHSTHGPKQNYKLQLIKYLENDTVQTAQDAHALCLTFTVGLHCKTAMKYLAIRTKCVGPNLRGQNGQQPGISIPQHVPANVLNNTKIQAELPPCHIPAKIHSQHTHFVAKQNPHECQECKTL